jgi:L-amino acid N-acyltransferase YncA
VGEAQVAEARAITLRRARPDDNDQIAALWNAALASAIMTSDTGPRTPASQHEWLARHGDEHLIVVVDVADDEALAYGSLSPDRDKPAFRATVEDSVYVKVGQRGIGMGSRVLAELLRRARERGHHTVIARIIADHEVGGYEAHPPSPHLRQRSS